MRIPQILIHKWNKYPRFFIYFPTFLPQSSTIGIKFRQFVYCKPSVLLIFYKSSISLINLQRYNFSLIIFIRVIIIYCISSKNLCTIFNISDSCAISTLIFSNILQCVLKKSRFYPIGFIFMRAMKSNIIILIRIYRHIRISPIHTTSYTLCRICYKCV